MMVGKKICKVWLRETGIEVRTEERIAGRKRTRTEGTKGKKEQCQIAM